MLIAYLIVGIAAAATILGAGHHIDMCNYDEWSKDVTDRYKKGESVKKLKKIEEQKKKDSQ